ncbi:MAG: hypothetical protein Q9211_004648 [Gyalolechia sp. 1 TL-2023]
MVLVDFERLGIDLSPPKRIQKTFGWRTAAQCRERTLEKMARAAPPPAAPKNLSVCDRIAARKARTLASLGPKVSNAIRKRQTAGVEGCTCCRRMGEPKKKLRWAPEVSLEKVDVFERYLGYKEGWQPAYQRGPRDGELGFRRPGWISIGYEDFPEDDSECDDSEDFPEGDSENDDETY